MNDSAMGSSIHSVETGRTAGSSSSNKRSRPHTPTNNSSSKRGSLDLATINNAAPNHVSKDALRADNLLNARTRNSELNELLQLSMNYEVNFSMQTDDIPKALARIVVFDCLQWKEPTQEILVDEPFVVFRSADSWATPPTCRSVAWAEHCRTITERIPDDDTTTIKTLEAIAVILRNFSFTGANLRLLAYSPDILHVLTAFLYIGATENSRSLLKNSSGDGTLTLSTLQTLLNLVRYLDVTGQQLLTDKLFYDSSGPPVPNASDFGKCVSGEWGGLGACWLAKRLDTREDTIENISTEILLDLTSDYLAAVWGIFPALKEVVLNEQSPRVVVLGALDLLQELINSARVGLVGTIKEETVEIKPGQDYEIPTLRAILVNMPDLMLNRLTDLLCIPRLGSDSLDYVDPQFNMVTRVTLLKLSMGYDATVDTDARDRALDVLVPLLELDSPKMASRFGRNSSGAIRTDMYDSLVPILTTKAGRNEASVLAAQLFRELSKADSNKSGLEYVQSRLIELASRDARVSLLVWNDLYNTSANENDPASGENDKAIKDS